MNWRHGADCATAKKSSMLVAIKASGTPIEIGWTRPRVTLSCTAPQKGAGSPRQTGWPSRPVQTDQRLYLCETTRDASPRALTSSATLAGGPLCSDDRFIYASTGDGRPGVYAQSIDRRPTVALREKCRRAPYLSERRWARGAVHHGNRSSTQDFTKPICTSDWHTPTHRKNRNPHASTPARCANSSSTPKGWTERAPSLTTLRNRGRQAGQIYLRERFPFGCNSWEVHSPISRPPLRPSSLEKRK